MHLNNKRIKKNYNETSSCSINKYLDNEDNLKKLFSGGGRHHSFLSGDIVYKYLQSYTNNTLLNDDLSKENEFKGYKLTNKIQETISDLPVPLYFSNVPLDQLLSCLNIRELQCMSKLHEIYIPKNITKKTLLTYFNDHHYISVFTENQPTIKIRKQKKLNTTSIESPSTHLPEPAIFSPDPPLDTLIETII